MVQASAKAMRSRDIKDILKGCEMPRRINVRREGIALRTKTHCLEPPATLPRNSASRKRLASDFHASRRAACRPRLGESSRC